MNRITSPAFRYTGAKWRIASWVISFFPEHLSYVEPCAGGASILIKKPVSMFEVLNDKSQDVINFFDVLRSRPEELIRAIELTPYARAEHGRAYREREALDLVERARRFYIRSRQSFGSGEGPYMPGWRFQKSNNRGKRVVDEWSKVDHLWAIASRLKQVMIECDDAFNIIPRYDGSQTLFYFDPPYPASTRWRMDAYYGHEMTDPDHERFAEMLREVQGMVIVSSYPSDLYDRLFEGWRTAEKSVSTNGNGARIEKLWISPRCDEMGQLPLFKGL